MNPLNMGSPVQVLNQRLVKSFTGQVDCVNRFGYGIHSHQLGTGGGHRIDHDHFISGRQGWQRQDAVAQNDLSAQSQGHENFKY